MNVLATEESDGTVRMTISFADEDHRFSVWGEDDLALVEYEETLSYRGTVRVSQPDQDVYETLFVSDEMSEFLDAHDLDGVKRANRNT